MRTRKRKNAVAVLLLATWIILELAAAHQRWQAVVAECRAMEQLRYFSVYEVETPMIGTVVGDRAILGYELPAVLTLIIYYASDTAAADLSAYEDTLKQAYGWRDIGEDAPADTSFRWAFRVEHDCAALEIPIQISGEITDFGYAIMIDPLEIR